MPRRLKYRERIRGGTVIPIFRRIYWPFCACKSTTAIRQKGERKRETHCANDFKYSTLGFFPQFFVFMSEDGLIFYAVVRVRI